MDQKNVIKRIPGEVSCSKRESQGYIDSLENKGIVELHDLLERQKKLLANRSFIAKLPDKGEKIMKFHDKIEKELSHRNEVAQAASLLSRLNIASEGKDAMNELEWTGKYDEKSSLRIVELDSDDDDDPLKILAQPTGTGVHKKKIINLLPEETLISSDDLKEIESFKTDDPLASGYVKHVTDKIENSNDKLRPNKELFKPHKTTLSNIHDPIKEKKRKKSKYWENTAATPPLIIHGAVKLLNIRESLALEKAKTERLEEIHAKHAIERLTQSIGMHSIGAIRVNAGAYRTSAHDSESSESDFDQEIYDDEDNDKAGTVVFPVDRVH